MATRRAVANGNWSATATWNGGVVPGNGDTVYAGGFNVTLDVDVTIGGANNPTVSAGSFVAGQWYEITFVGTTSWTAIGAASNTLGVVFLATGAGSGTGEAKARATISTAANTSAGAAAGGSFIMSTVRTFTADIRAGTTRCLDVTASSGTLTLTDIIGFGGASANAHAINNGSTATIDLNSVSFTGGTALAHACQNASTGSITVSSSCTFTGNNLGIALNNAAGGSITISASCTFTGGTANSASAINNASTGSITVSSSCTFTGGTNSTALTNNSTGTVTISGPSTFTGGLTATGFALNNASTGAITVTSGTFTASSANVAVNIANAAADVRLSGDFLDHWSGWRAVNGAKWRVHTTPTNARTRYALDGTTDSYLNMFTADNNLTQALPADVRSGTVYADGNLTGTCAVPAASSVGFGVPVDNTTGTAALTPASVWDHLLSAITTSDTIGTLLKTNIDATISSRSTATTAGIADAVWDEVLTGATHNIASSAGRRLRILDEERIIADGQVQSATTNTVTLEPIGTLCVGQTIVVTDQATNDKQTRFILSFDPGTYTATVDSDWCVVPTAGDEYLLTTVRDPLVTRADHPAGTVGAEIDEMYLIHGLKTGSNLTVTPTSRTAGAVAQTISGDGTTSTTVSRD